MDCSYYKVPLKDTLRLGGSSVGRTVVYRNPTVAPSSTLALQITNLPTGSIKYIIIIIIETQDSSTLVMDM